MSADDRLARIVEDLRERRLPPRTPAPEPIAHAWGTSANFSAMIELLAIASELGLVALDERTTRSEGGRTRFLSRLRDAGGRYVRIDVSGASPGELARALRAAVPEVPTQTAWLAAIGAERAGCTDPLAALLMDVRRFGAPSADWLRGHTLRSAWETTSSSEAILEVLARAGRADLRRAAEQALAREAPPGTDDLPDDAAGFDASLRRIGAWRLAVVRRVAPSPPEWAVVPRHVPGALGELVVAGVLSEDAIAALVDGLPPEHIVRTVARGGEAFDSTRWPLARDAALAALAAERLAPLPDVGPQAAAALALVRRAADEGLYAYHVHRGLPGPTAEPAAALLRAALERGVLTVDEIVARARAVAT